MSKLVIMIVFYVCTQEKLKKATVSTESSESDELIAGKVFLNDDPEEKVHTEVFEEEEPPTCVLSPCILRLFNSRRGKDDNQEMELCHSIKKSVASSEPPQNCSELPQDISQSPQASSELSLTSSNSQAEPKAELRKPATSQKSDEEILSKVPLNVDSDEDVQTGAVREKENKHEKELDDTAKKFPTSSEPLQNGSDFSRASSEFPPIGSEPPETGSKAKICDTDQTEGNGQQAIENMVKKEKKKPKFGKFFKRIFK